MAGAGNIEIRTTEYRPCYVTEAVAYSEGMPVVKHERKALFHRWACVERPYIKISQFSRWEDVQAIKRQFHGDHIVLDDCDVFKEKCTVAIVEFEDGNVAEVEPSAVRFVPGLMNEYDFMEVVNEAGNGSN